MLSASHVDTLYPHYLSGTRFIFSKTTRKQDYSNAVAHDTIHRHCQWVHRHLNDVAVNLSAIQIFTSINPSKYYLQIFLHHTCLHYEDQTINYDHGNNRF